MRTVAHVMSPDPLTVPEDASAEACAELMARNGVRHLPVVDGEGQLAGVVVDLALYALELDFDPQAGAPDAEALGAVGLEARDLAVQAEVVSRPGASFRDVLRKLLASSDDVAVVVDPLGHPVGVITEHDIVRLAAELMPLEVSAMSIATARLLTVSPAQSRDLALALTQAGRQRHVLVTDGGRLVGVLSLRDVVRTGHPTAHESVGALDRRDRPQQVGALIGGRPIVAPVDASLRGAARIMVEHAIGCVPLVDERGHPVAVVTRTDVARGLLVLLSGRPEPVFQAAEE